MNRSRNLLIVAWGLLAIGTVFQLVRPDSSATDTADGPSGDLAFTDEGEPTDADESNETDGGTTTDDRLPVEDPERATTSAPAGDADGGPPEVVLAEESFVATVTGPGVVSMAEPVEGDIQHWFPNPTQFGGERVFMVTDQTSSEQYVKVSLPVKPNGQEGWILRSEVEITAIHHRALIDLSEDSVTVWDEDGIVVRSDAVTGKPSTPTPLGVFYVRDVVTQDDPAGAFGPYVLALSGFSEVLDTFDGGLPALAIHGTNRPDQIGSEVSSGCIRIPNDLISILAESVPLGTPVTVVA